MIGEVINALLTNPTLAVVVVAIAVILAKLFKVAGKIIKWIILIGIAYVVVTVFLSGVV